MKKLLIIALALGVATATAEAYDLTTTCPQDGETAYFAGTKVTVSGTTCKYQHSHYDVDTHRTINHSFWIPCE